jgi:hypothetical protein
VQFGRDLRRGQVGWQVAQHAELHEQRAAKPDPSAGTTARSSHDANWRNKPDVV